MGLKEDEIIANVEQYILNAKLILAGGDNSLNEKEEIELYTLQATLEGILKLYREKQKEVLLYRDHIRTSVCLICGKEFKHRNSTAKYCTNCKKTKYYKIWKNNLTDEKLKKRRKQSREATSRYRAKLIQKGDNKNESC